LSPQLQSSYSGKFTCLMATSPGNLPREWQGTSSDVCHPLNHSASKEMLRAILSSLLILLANCTDSKSDFEISEVATGDESFVVINREYLVFTGDKYPVLAEDYITSRMHDDYMRLLIEEMEGSRLDPQQMSKMERLAGHFYHNDPLWRLDQEIAIQLEILRGMRDREVQPEAEEALKEALACLHRARGISDSGRILEICDELRYCIITHNPARIRDLADRGFFDPTP